MRSLLVPALVAIGCAGLLVTSVTFVRVTLPRHYGSNPGFGAYESAAAPWWGALCLALGLHTGSLVVGIASLGLGLLLLGFLAQLLSWAFGRRG